MDARGAYYGQCCRNILCNTRMESSGPHHHGDSREMHLSKNYALLGSTRQTIASEDHAVPSHESLGRPSIQCIAKAMNQESRCPTPGDTAEGFLQKYGSRELFHKRSKHSLYRRMLRKNQTLEAKCQEKDMLLESPDNTIEAFVTNQESRCPTLGDIPTGLSSKISEQRAISQTIKRQNVSQNAQEKSNSASKLP